MDRDQLKLRRLDFSMLLVLRALVRSQKTTAVAEELGLSQSAVSHTLSRLREIFADPLFLRNPNGLQPTHRALELLPKVEAVLRAAEDALQAPSRFDPATASRSFRLAGNDLVGATIAPSLTTIVRDQAPACRIAFRFLVGAQSLDALRTNNLDLALGRIWDLPEDFQAAPIFEENFVVVVRRNHPVTRRGQLTIEDYLALDHVLVSFRGGFWGMVDHALKRRRLKRRVVASVPMFMTAMTTAAQTSLAATVPSRIAAKHARQLGLKTLQAPLKIQDFTISLVRHIRSAGDTGLDWLSQRIFEAARR